MEITLIIILHLILVPLLYRSAYRSGYNACRDQTASAVKEMSEPISELFDNLDKTIEHLLQTEKRNGNSREETEE